MKKVKLLSVLLLSTALTLAGCNNGNSGTSSTDSGSNTQDPSSGPTSAPTSGPTSDPSSSSSTSEVPPAPSWPADLQEAQEAALYGHVLPFVEGTWSIVASPFYGAIDLTAEDVEEADVVEALEAAGFEFVQTGSYGVSAYALYGEDGSTFAAYVGYDTYDEAFYYCGEFMPGPSEIWTAEDIELMEYYLYGTVLPHPSGAWYAPYASSGTVITYSFDEDVSEDSVAAEFEEAGYFVAVASDGDGYEFTTIAPEKYVDSEEVEHTVYVNGYIFTRLQSSGDIAVILNASPSLTPMLSFDVFAELDVEVAEAGSQVTLDVTLGGAYSDTDVAIVEVSPEGAATLNEELSEGNSFVFDLAEDLEPDTEVTFTAYVEGHEEDADVASLTIVAKADWTLTEKILMDFYWGFQLPFLGSHWSVNEVGDEESGYDIVVVTDEPGHIEEAEEVFFEEGYASRYFEGFGSFFVQKVLPSEEESFTPFVYYLGLWEELDEESGEGYDELYLAGFDDYISSWGDDDAALMEEHLSGIVLPCLPGVYDPWEYDADYDQVFSYSYTASLDEMCDYLEELGFELNIIYYLFYDAIVYDYYFDEEGYVCLSINLVEFSDNSLGMAAWFTDNTPETFDEFPVETITDFLRANIGEEFEPVLVTELDLPEDVTVEYAWEEGGYLNLNFSRELTEEELLTLRSSYADALLEAGYTNESGSYFDSPDIGEFYIYLPGVSGADDTYYFSFGFNVIPEEFDEFPVEAITEYLRDEIGDDEFEPVLVTEFVLPEDVEVTFEWAEGALTLNFSRELTLEELETLRNSYVDALLEAGYTEYGSSGKWYDSPDGQEFYATVIPVEEASDSYTIYFYAN